MRIEGIRTVMIRESHEVVHDESEGKVQRKKFNDLGVSKRLFSV